MKIKGGLWVWLQSYGTKVLRGEQSGGQRDIRLGKSIRFDLRGFFEGTDATVRSRRFEFDVQPYANVPLWNFRLLVNSSNVARAHEVRLVRQDPRSQEAYPLWKFVVERISDNARPKQALLFLKDHSNRIHVRCIDRSSFRHLPAELVEVIKASLTRARAPAGVWSSDGSAQRVNAQLAQSLPGGKIRRKLSWIAKPRPSPAELKRRGRLGETYVVGILRERYPEPNYQVEHVSEDDPGSPFDIRVVRVGRRQPVLYVEVKATVGRTGTPIEISQREVTFRRRNRDRHRIFVVYLRRGGTLPPHEVLEMDSDDQFVLSPREYLLWPKVSQA